MAARNVGVEDGGGCWGVYTGDTRVGSRGYQINVPVNAGAPIITQSGTVCTASASNDSLQKNYFIPSIMVSGQGHVAMGFSTAGETANANAGTVGRLATDPLGTMQVPVAITTNTNTYNPTSDPGGISAGRPRRWGDYSNTSVHPVHHTHTRTHHTLLAPHRCCAGRVSDHARTRPWPPAVLAPLPVSVRFSVGPCSFVIILISFCSNPSHP